jgi:hypothetical protein
VSKASFIRLALAPTSRTDLLCIACNRFSRGVAGKMLALVTAAGESEYYGVHAACRAGVHSGRGRKPAVVKGAA